MRTNKRGFTLTEILIAMAIFALGGVSIVGLFIANMRMARNAMDATRSAEIMRNVRALVTASLTRPISLNDRLTVYRFDYPGTSLKFKPKDLVDRETGNTGVGGGPNANRDLFGSLEENMVFYQLPDKPFDATLWGSEDARRQMTTTLPNDGLGRTGERKFTGTPPEVFRLLPDNLRNAGVLTGYDVDDRVFYSFDFSIRRGVSRSSAPIAGSSGPKLVLDDLYVIHLRVYKGFDFASDNENQAQNNKPYFEWDFLVSAAK